MFIVSLNYLSSLDQVDLLLEEHIEFWEDGDLKYLNNLT